VRKRVFDQIGEFSTALGPNRHNLAGGEDSDYVLRTLSSGEFCQYSPRIVQYHYVDRERLRLSYILKKSFQRTRSVTQIRNNGLMPAYLWRKLAGYLFFCIFSFTWSGRRFYMVRTAAVLGEMAGYRNPSSRK